MKKLVCGVGVNDADYPITREVVIDGKRKTIWRCPFYKKWENMLCRCYNKAYQARHSSYVGCSTVPEWHYFMTFRAWMQTQDWQGKVLDKDLLVKGNRVYGPETCLFIHSRVNNFIRETLPENVKFAVGVQFVKTLNKFVARGKDIETNSYKHLGTFSDWESAQKAWVSFKLKQATILAKEQDNPTISKAILDRYENYFN